jgi:hypothetical protein
MKIAVRRGRLIRIGLALSIVPLLYLLFSYSDTHKKLNGIYGKKLVSSIREPFLASEGEMAVMGWIWQMIWVYEDFRFMNGF